MTTSVLKAPSRYMRAYAPTAKPERVDKEERVIYGASVSTRGEALGHNLWLDRKFLSQIVDAGNNSKNGVKVRFGHPMCGDGLGKAVARAKNFRLTKDRVFADLYMLKSSEDLANYVLNLAEEAPDLFGMSIVYSPDMEEEEKFSDKYTKDGLFNSPDGSNSEHLKHARLLTLNACDVVDEPAANPEGLFHEGGEIFVIGEQMMNFLFKNGSCPDVERFNIHPDRIKEHVDTWLARNSMSITKKEEPMESVDGLDDYNTEVTMKEVIEEVEEELAATADEDMEEELEALDDDEVECVEFASEEFEMGMNLERERCSEIIEEFEDDPSFAIKCIKDGKTVDEAKLSKYELMKKELKLSKKEVSREGVSPIPHGKSVKTTPTSPESFVEMAKQLSKEKNISVIDAMKELKKNN